MDRYEEVLLTVTTIWLSLNLLRSMFRIASLF
jgi:hypothetical protein